MRLRLIMPLVGFFCMVAGANAADSREPRDWFWVVNSLRSHGIDSNRVPWHIINQACMWAPLDSDEFAGCQYEKAMDRAQHASDRDTCWAQARAQYPDALKVITPTVVPVYRHGYPYYATGIPVDVNSSRNAVMGSCMIALGWKSPTNYMLGKREMSVPAAASAQ